MVATGAALSFFVQRSSCAAVQCSAVAGLDMSK